MKITMSIITLALCALACILPNLLVNNSLAVEYVVPKAKSMTEYVYCTGTIESEKYSEIYTDTPIYPDIIHYQIGDRVEKGDKLVTVDTQTTLNILTSSTPMEASINKLSTIISSLPDPELLYTMGKSYGMTPQQIDEIYSSAKYAKTDVETYYIPQEINAPFSGIVTEVPAKEGMLTKTNQPVITICDTKALRAVVKVNQNDVSKLEYGMEAIIYDGVCEATGKIERIAPVAQNPSASTPTVDVMIALNEPSDFKVGYTVNAKIMVKESQNVLTIPIDAIRQDENNHEFVYALVEGQPVKKEITVGTETAYASEVIAGIGNNELIIVTGEDLEKNKRIYIKGEKMYNEEQE